MQEVPGTALKTDFFLFLFISKNIIINYSAKDTNMSNMNHQAYMVHELKTMLRFALKWQIFL